jgi:hypothetical protein
LGTPNCSFWKQRVSYIQISFASIAWVTSSNNSGASWSTPIQLSSPNHPTGWPLDVVVSGNNVFTIYGSATTLGGSIWNAYASYSADGGNTWTSRPRMDLSANNVGVAAPATDIASASIKANGTAGYAAWQSSQAGLNQIWFASS